MAVELAEVDRERVHRLIAHSALAGVHFHEQSARRHDESPEGDLADGANVEVGIQYRLADEDFGIRVKADVQNLIGTATVVVSGEYSISEGYKPTRRDVMMFANEVAVMTIFPYLREGISDATSKVFGDPILLPIAPRGAIAFVIDDEDPDLD